MFAQEESGRGASGASEACIDVTSGHAWPSSPADAVVFAAGDAYCRSSARLPLKSDGIVVCADAGLAACFQLGFTPNLVVGDFDSVAPELVERAREAGAVIREYPVDKDQTDLELALAEAAAAARSGAVMAAADACGAGSERPTGSGRVIVTGVTGGRIDHTLGSLDVCLGHARQGARVIVVEEWGEAFFIAGPTRRACVGGVSGQIVSVLPQTEDASGVSTHGLKFPLACEPLRFGEARGVSNRMTGARAWVEAEAGELIVVHLLNAVACD